MKVNFRTSDFRRKVADAGSIVLKNRYFEQNPFLDEDGAALLARPGMRKLVDIGAGPIRGMESMPGSFNGDLFVVSGEEVYRMKNNLEKEAILAGLSDGERGFVNMAITGRIDEIPEYLFIADGTALYCYIENGFAHNTLTGSMVANDVIRIDDTYYKYTSGSVDAGTPEGTSANPWLVSLGADISEAFANLFYAVNVSGVPGVDYSTNTQENPVVQATQHDSSTMTVRAKVAGAPGNGIVTTETGAGLVWSLGATLAGGGEPYVTAVQMPEDVGVIDVAVISSYVIVIPQQIDGFQGRFYWIKPGETTIDGLDYATAERSPDGIFGVQVFGDQFWLPGESTTEVWFPTGDPDIPMRRLEGVVFDRGSWQNTAKAIHEQMVVVDADGGVFLIQGGSPQRISTPDIEEHIRLAMARSNYLSI